MIFVIGNQKENEVKNGFYLTVETMTGDADDYHTFTLSFEKNLKELEDAVNILNTAERTDPNFYVDILGFSEMFRKDWHYSFFYNRYSSFENYEITYYKDGKCFEVEVIEYETN